MGADGGTDPTAVTPVANAGLCPDPTRVATPPTTTPDTFPELGTPVLASRSEPNTSLTAHVAHVYGNNAATGITTPRAAVLVTTPGSLQTEGKVTDVVAVDDGGGPFGIPLARQSTDLPPE